MLKEKIKQNPRFSAGLAVILVFLSIFSYHYDFFYADGQSMYPYLRKFQPFIITTSDNVERGNMVVFRPTKEWVESAYKMNLHIAKQEKINPNRVKRESGKIAKRIIAIEGDTISYGDNALTVHTKEGKDIPIPFPKECPTPKTPINTVVPQRHIYVAGDNIHTSLDSRTLTCFDFIKTKDKLSWEVPHHTFIPVENIISTGDSAYPTNHMKEKFT